MKCIYLPIALLMMNVSAAFAEDTKIDFNFDSERKELESRMDYVDPSAIDSDLFTSTMVQQLNNRVKSLEETVAVLVGNNNALVESLDKLVRAHEDLVQQLVRGGYAKIQSQRLKPKLLASDGE